MYWLVNCYVREGSSASNEYLARRFQLSPKKSRVLLHPAVVVTQEKLLIVRANYLADDNIILFVAVNSSAWTR